MAKNIVESIPIDAISGKGSLPSPFDDLSESRWRKSSSDLNALKFTIAAVREELGDNISVVVNCAGKCALQTTRNPHSSDTVVATAHFKDTLSHTDDEYQYTLIVNALAPILVCCIFALQSNTCPFASSNNFRSPKNCLVE
jgi:NAD(P)-dependent dehydrogenase (short-subunit alcohol dehydrogenase family)